MGDLDTNPGKESEQLLKNTKPFTEHFYDKTKEEIDLWMDNQGQDFNRILYIEFNYHQIGKTEKWFRDISAKINNPRTVRREILLQRLHGSSLSPYPQEDIEYIVENMHNPIDELWLLDYYKFDLYKKLDKRIPYIAGVDCSTGTVGDNNAITLLDPYTLEPVAEFESSFIGETMYENLIRELVHVLPRVVLCIERNSIGDGIIDHLLHSDVAGRLYFDKNKDLVEQNNQTISNVESMLKTQAMLKTYYGVWTGNQSRDDMFAILARHVNEYKEKFITKNIIRDLSKLVKKASGKIEAGAGFHDDSIMSYLIALYVWYHGNNLSVFGIEKGAMMDESELNKGMKTPEEIDSELVDIALIEEVKNQQKKERNTESWEKIMRDAISKSQNESYKMSQAGLVQNTVFDNSTNTAVDLYGDYAGGYDKGLFNELNGINEDGPYDLAGRPGVYGNPFGQSQDPWGV